jgi:plasmid maintenance system antidote protein VapI
MRYSDIRLKNFRHLVREAGGASFVARKLGVSQSRISHLIGVNPHRKIGEKTAIKIEKVFNKPDGWLDKIHPDNEGI